MDKYVDIESKKQKAINDEKKRYTVRYTETYTGYFDVEAEKSDDVVDEFFHLVGDGKIDLLHMEMTDSKVEIEM